MQPITVALPTELLDASGIVAVDIACRHCGYNLRGLHRERLCPECATPVGRSVLGDLLRFADPDWVGRLARGVGWLLWGILITILANLIGAVALGPLGSPAASRTAPALVPMIALLASLAGLYGAWLVSSPDPSGIGEDRTVTARKLVRLGMLATLANHLISPSADLAGSPLLKNIIFFAGLLFTTVGEFAKYWLFQRFAQRVPQAMLERRARFLKIALPVATLLTLVDFVVAHLLGARIGGPRAPRGMGPICAIGLIGITHLVLLLFAVRLQYLLGRELCFQAALARETWTGVARPAGAEPLGSRFIRRGGAAPSASPASCPRHSPSDTGTDSA